MHKTIDFLEDKDRNGNRLRNRVPDRGMRAMINCVRAPELICNGMTLWCDESFNGGFVTVQRDDENLHEKPKRSLEKL